MLAGRYPCDEFAELRPRLVWDRVAGTLTGPAGAQRLAVTCGGTIPDRGLFGVFLVGREGVAGSASSTRRWSTSRGSATSSPSERRPGGSRTSPTTGCSSRPRRASPAGCRSGRATSSAVRPSSARPSARSSASSTALARRGAATGCSPTGLDDLGRRQPRHLPARAAQATGHVPDDRTIVVERFRDELGDWRMCIHTPFGGGVHAPWALCDQRPAARPLRRRRPGDARRRRHRAADPRHRGRRPPGAESRARSTPTRSSSWSPTRSAVRRCSRPGSASARRGRCCCPGATPGGASRCGSSASGPRSCSRSRASTRSFPIVLEAVRECLQDVFDVPGAGRAHARHRARQAPRRRGRDPASRRRSRSR